MRAYLCDVTLKITCFAHSEDEARQCVSEQMKKGAYDDLLRVGGKCVELKVREEK